MASTPVGPAGPTGNITGASTPHTAIDAFMAAIKAEDLQAMGAIWGTADGPARSQMSMDQLQERELTMMCYLVHDSFRILTDAPALNGTRNFAVEVKFREMSHTGQFNVGRASDGRYYVFSVVNFGEFQDFCARKRKG
jgi:hypothetical protein